MVKKIKWVGTLSTTERNNIGLIQVRQNNVNSEVLGFNIVDGNGEPYDLKNRKVLFCTYFDKFAPVEQYAEVIENGKIIYMMNEHDMQKPVRINFAYFKIMDDKDNLVDTTQNFSYDIMPSVESKCMNSEPYIIRLEEVLDSFLQINTDAKKELEQIIIDFNEQVIEQQQSFEFWFESIREILESVDPEGVILNELVDFRYSELLDKNFNRMKNRGDFWDFDLQQRGYNVRWFGAVGDGVTDDTDAFNRATAAYEKHEDGNMTKLKRTIIVPPGDYLIKGTVYVRKGQHLKGTGLGPSRIIIPVKSDGPKTFDLGRGFIDGEVVEDSGGLPPSISNLQTNGGSLSEAVFDGSEVAGITLNNLFITNAGIALDMPAGDLNAYNLTIDDGSIGVKISGSRNVFTACSFFWNNFNIIAGFHAADIIFSSCNFAFSKFADIEFRDYQAKNISFDKCNFITNDQYSTFYGNLVFNNTKDAVVNFSDCYFSNTNNYALTSKGTASNNEAVFENCSFDGNKTHRNYSQGSNSKVVYVHNDKYIFNSCKFKNITGKKPFNLSGYSGALELNRCEWINVTDDTLVHITENENNNKIYASYNKGDNNTKLLNPSKYATVDLVENRRWLGSYEKINNENVYKVPVFKRGIMHVVDLTANTAPKGSTLYRKNGKFLIDIYSDLENISVSAKAVKHIIYRSPASTYVPAVDIDISYLDGFILIKIPSEWSSVILEVI